MESESESVYPESVCSELESVYISKILKRSNSELIEISEIIVMLISMGM